MCMMKNSGEKEACKVVKNLANKLLAILDQVPEA